MAESEPNRTEAPERPPEVDASLYLHPQTLAKLGSFELRAKMIIEGVSGGAHRSPFQGFSVEFSQHRAYAPGDDIRHLDWKVYARTDRLQLKQYRQETNLDLMILVDSSGSMMYGSRSFEDASGEGRRASLDGRSHWSKYDHATALAAALSYITLRQGDRAGLTIYSDDVKAALRRSSGRNTWRQIVGLLATHHVQPMNRSRKTDLSRVIDQTLSTLTNRCLIALISDLFVDLDELREALARVRHARHDLIVFQVLDREEERFSFEDSAPFEGLEGEAAVRVDPRALRKAYLEIFEEHRSGAEKLIKSFGYDYHRICTHDWLGPPLASFVARRNAMMKRSKLR
ncbi:MAG: DUF58 domain-containing protein [Phycisphaerales bacterium]